MFGYLQKVGRALMIPVAVLPAAAILMGIGYWVDPHGWGSNSMLAALLIKSGGAIIDNMSMLFAVGVAFGMSKDKNGSAALTGLVGFMVVTTLLSPGSVALLQKINIDLVDVEFGKINNQFIGILVGIIASELYNRYSAVQLHKALSFFSGKRLVPIIMSFAMILLSFILLYVWPIIFTGLVHFGETMTGLGPLGAGIFGFFNRLLIPFGLHHALNSVFWFDVAGINDIPNFLAGAQTITDKGKEIKGVVGMYQAGFFPIMMFGLLGAALAFIKTAKPENRNRVMGVMMAAGFASFFTGVTEPLEFSFMFLAPQLYVLHALFTGISLFIAAKMHWIAGFGFSAGLVDFVLSSRNPLAIRWFMLVPQGIAFFALYYFSFTALIKIFKLKTPGREDDEEESVVVVSKNHKEIAEKLLPLLGGKANIKTIDNCVTRLRLELVDTKIIEKDELNKIVPGVLVMDKTNVQIVIGTQVEFIATAFAQIVGMPHTSSVSTASNSSVSSNSEKIKPGSHAELAAALLPLLGGKENIVSVDNCITRLRLDVKDSSIVNKDEITKIASGIITPSKKAVQVIIGTEVEFVADEFRKLV